MIQITEYSDKKYKVLNGTFYHLDTPDDLVYTLERLRTNGTRIRLHYGDVQTGKDWMDVYDVAGKLSRSMGPVKIPILIHNARSMGGGGILDNCIVRIRYANKRQGRDIYKHPLYHEDLTRK